MPITTVKALTIHPHARRAQTQRQLRVRVVFGGGQFPEDGQLAGIAGPWRSVV